jgi:hypothetical protein
LLSTEPILIAQLALGEPPDLSFGGATRAAQEWFVALQQSEREVFPFLLSLDWTDAASRIPSRPHAKNDIFGLLRDFGLYALFEHGHDLAMFPTFAGLNEVKLSTSGRTPDQLADEIMKKAGLL